ncbi:trigger factor [Pontibacter sp. BT310]|uniref:Trigger factor n=1 Tax=Pontibacter populi TaxID=890055 RepID=A0ABS6XEU4_9BACT|nr:MULTISPECIES: trigger factor [Pontibacter]MBJ6119305.1 trigger factor [Pontibacter sp. BT310]MBR0571733.1 trigger factor [Microvirga sp. STS03]MBW3366159.1 trigger factor [Pontibacter populi]
MNITLNQTDSTNAQLKVVLEEADYASKVDQQVKEFSKKAQIKGFRPGKVPAGLVKKMYGKSILVEQINKLLQEEISKYIKDNDVKLLGEPLPEPSQANIDWDNQKDFEFTYAVGLLPDFNLPLDKSVDGYAIELDKKTIDEAYENIKRQFGKTTNPETSEEGDFIYGDLKQVDGEFESKTLIPTSRVVAGKEQFIGVKAGDVIKFDIRKAFGDDNAALAHVTGLSKEVTAELNGEFEFTVEKINRTEEAELNQELFDKLFGKDAITTEEEFDAKIRETIKENYDREADNLLNRNIIDTLVDNVAVDIPADFFKRWLQVTNEGRLTTEQIEENFDKYTKELKWSMIKNKVVEENELKVSNDEVVSSTKEKMMAQFNMPEIPEELAESMNNYAQQYLQQDNGRNYINEYEQLLAEKVLAKLKEKMTVVEKSISAEDFRNLSF